MTERTCQAIVLAAGVGTRMKSRIPKVMHKIAGRPMLMQVMKTAEAAGASRMDVVIGPHMKDVTKVIVSTVNGSVTHVQEERLGTAHAVLSARKSLEKPSDDILVLYGDTPLIRRATLELLRGELAGGADVAVLGFNTDQPEGYGRLILDDTGRLTDIREEKDATEEERQITFCNSGVMAFAGVHILEILTQIGNDNAKGEYYLTDAVEVARRMGLRVTAITGDEQEVLGVNTRAQLVEAETNMQNRLRSRALDGGVTMTAPDTVFLSFDTKLGADVTVEPHVFFATGVTVEEGATIKAFSHLEGATVSRNASVGPFARLRPGANIGESARIGNFVEVKNSDIQKGAKAGHLAYLGDATVGENANIGAGTITCNYDGYLKHRTRIGNDAFIGSNSSLVAPVTIGDGAYVGSGSVITRDVEPNALAVERGKQVVKSGWAAEQHARMNELKDL